MRRDGKRKGMNSREIIRRLLVKLYWMSCLRKMKGNKCRRSTIKKTSILKLLLAKFRKLWRLNKTHILI